MSGSFMRAHLRELISLPLDEALAVAHDNLNEMIESAQITIQLYHESVPNDQQEQIVFLYQRLLAMLMLCKEELLVLVVQSDELLPQQFTLLVDEMLAHTDGSQQKKRTHIWEPLPGVPECPHGPGF